MDMCAVRLDWWKLSKYTITHDLSDCQKFFPCSFGEKLNLDYPVDKGFT